jgi:hypothetical protein
LAAPPGPPSALLDPQIKAQADNERKPWTELCKAIFASKLIPLSLWDRFEFPFLEKVGASIGVGAQTMLKKSTRLGTVTL